MTFLNSAFLFLLSAVSIPLIIHFLSKRRIKTIEFSSLKFLEQMQKSRMRWLKIKELILLILRMAVIGLIVLAFARPTLRGFAGSSRASSSAVIIIDRSASMDAEGETGTLFEEAKRLASRLIDSFESGDQITIIAYPGQGEPEVIGPLNAGNRIKEKIASIDISYQAGNIGQALVRARDILAHSPDLNHEIYIFSDMQDANFRDLPGELFTREAWKNIHLFTIPPKPTGGENIAISDVLVPAQLLVPGEDFDIETELTNYSKGSLENVLVGVVVDNERKAQTTISLPPNQPTRLRFNLKLDLPGDHGGYVEIDHDSFEPDNKRYFSLHIPEKIKLLAVGQGSSDPVKLALDRPEAGQISFVGIDATGLLREDLSKYNVILLNDIPSLDASRESAISGFVAGGGGLFVILGKSADNTYWQKFLPSISGITPGPLSGKDGEYLTWNNFDYENPIFSIYSSNPSDRAKPAIPDINITFYHNLSGGRSIGSSPNGVNIMAESKKNPIIVLGSGLDLASGDLAAHSLIIPLLVRSVEYLGSQNSGGGVNGIIGQPMQWRTPGNITQSLSLLSPTGAAEDLQPVIEGNSSTVRITEYGAPGIYTMMASDKKQALLAFNVDNTESENAAVSAGDISGRLGVAVKSIAPDSDLKATVLQARFGRELWKELLILALLLLIAESIIGRTSPPKALSNTSGESQ
jgi:hypothetical protein